MNQTPILEDIPSVTIMKVSPAISPRTPTSKCDSLGIIYGLPITSLQFGRIPTKMEVVQLYMHLYDQKRGNSTFKMPKDGKKEVIKKIKDHLKANLEYQNLECTLKEVTIINKINGLIEQAESWGKSRNKLIGNFNLIAQKREKHSVEFDITGQSLQIAITAKRRYIDGDFEDYNMLRAIGN